MGKRKNPEKTIDIRYRTLQLLESFGIDTEKKLIEMSPEEIVDIEGITKEQIRQTYHFQKAAKRREFYSRAIAMKIYDRIFQLRPSWTEKVAVVMTESNKDPEEWRAVIGNKHHRDELAKTFKDNDSPLKIAIVVDMWLTGFDVPSLATMYVYKPMQGYNLMQAIARVNRVFEDKEGGLVVDYVGIASALKEAMNDYTSRDKKKYGDGWKRVVEQASLQVITEF